MKIFVDTNIFLDVLLKRASYQSALQLLNGIAEHRWQAVILDITILNIDYVARKQVKDIKDFLYLINENCQVVGATNIEINQALQIDNPDLEDNLQYICAVENGCDAIITNDIDFYSEKLKTFTSNEFIGY